MSDGHILPFFQKKIIWAAQNMHVVKLNVPSEKLKIVLKLPAETIVQS